MKIAYLAAGKSIEYGRRQGDEDIGSLVILGMLGRCLGKKWLTPSLVPPSAQNDSI